MEKIKRGLLIIASVVFVVVVLFWISTTGVEHIEDTNGPDIYKLQTITDYDIVDMKMGSKGLTETTSKLTGVTTYSSNKFTGVAHIYLTNIISNRMEFTINHARVDKGNFKIALVVDDEIVHEFKLNELTQSYVLEDVKGTVALVIAGESADFQLDYSVL